MLWLCPNRGESDVSNGQIQAVKVSMKFRVAVKLKSECNIFQ